VCFVVLHSSQDHLETGTNDLDHPISYRCKNTNSWRARNGHLQCDFPLDVPMVPLSVIAVTADGEHLMSVDSPLAKLFALGTLSSSPTASVTQRAPSSVWLRPPS
jgi:hypothetical protein